MIRSGIPAYWVEKRFDQLNLDAKLSEKVTDIAHWLFEDPVSITLLSKSNGCGKTHIAVCLLRKFMGAELSRIARRHGTTSSAFTDYKRNYILWDGDIYEQIQSSFQQGYKGASREQLISKYARQDFLVIDDMFSSRVTDFTREVMLSIIHKRIDWERKPTVITSNLSLEEIKEIDSRIYSKLHNGLVLEIKSVQKDWRGEKK